MSAPRDPERLVRAFIDEGPTELPDRAVASILSEITRTHQRAMFGPWRTLSMSRPALAAILIVAVVSIGGLALWATRPALPSSASQPTHSPTAMTSPSQILPSASPTFRGSAVGTIAYGRYDAAEAADHLYAVAAAGGVPRQLDSRPSCCLTVSPDGRSIVYGVTVSGSRIQPAARSLTNDTPASLFDSPAGVNLNLAPGAISSKLDLAFSGWDERDETRNGIYLSIGNGGGLIWGNFERLTTNTDGLLDVPLGFSPDGSKLMFLRAAPGAERGDLYVIGLDGSGLRQLNRAPSVVQASALFGAGASWAPDGRRAAFTAFDPGAAGCDATGVFVVDVASSISDAIADPDGCATSARWSPDGTWIAFERATNAPGDHDVWVMHPDGSGPVNVGASIATGVCCAQWSPDSSRLLVQAGDASKADVNLWIVDVDGSHPALLTSVTSLYKWYAWSPEQ
jgi:dipeptidyl aminopeptidase/acylaminoacyl peptidase